MEIKTITQADWEAEGTRLFGPDKMQWRFVCPACGHIAAVKDWQAAGAPEGAVAFSCIGRWAGAKREAFGEGDGPCNYAGGGLIGLNPVRVLANNGKESNLFEFAEPQPDSHTGIDTDP